MYAIKRALKLNDKQKTLMAQHAGFSRLVYNYGLNLFWSSVKEGVKASDSKRLQAIKKCLTNVTKKREDFAWMKELSSKVYQSALQDLQTAFSRWRKGIASAPTYKRRKDKRSFTVYDGNGVVLIPAGGTIKIPTLGTFRLQEPLTEGYITQTFTLSEEGGRWFVSFSVDAARIPPITHSVTKPIGIDLGVTCFATISDGTEIVAPKPLKRAIIKLKKLQYHNRNKQFGDKRAGTWASSNAKKYFRKLSRLHKSVANERKDFLGKTTTSICQKYAHICIEDLNVAGMIANHKLAAAISDLGFYEFRRQLEYKAPVFGCKLDIIDRWFPSSKQCRKCGQRNDALTLRDRTFVCSHCEHTESRDLHASKNLANAPEDKRSRIGSIRTDACGQVAADCLG